MDMRNSKSNFCASRPTQTAAATRANPDLNPLNSYRKNPLVRSTIWGTMTFFGTVLGISSILRPLLPLLSLLGSTPLGDLRHSSSEPLASLELSEDLQCRWICRRGGRAGDAWASCFSKGFSVSAGLVSNRSAFFPKKDLWGLRSGRYQINSVRHMQLWCVK